MPIPLGILAAAGVRPAGAAGAYELIETVTVGSGGAASVSFTGLSAYSTTYQHLQIRAVAKSTANEPLRDLLMQFNGVTTADYSLHLLYGLGGSVTSGASANTSSIAMGGIPGAQSSSGTFGAQVIDILDCYETTKFKTARSIGGFIEDSGSFRQFVSLSSGNWRSTNAISSVTLFPVTGNLAQFSRFSIYGLKAS